MTGDITAARGDANTNAAFKNCAPFTKWVTHINDEHVDNAENLDVVMPMYNLIEYSDNYSDTSGSLWQFKRDEIPVNNADLSIDNSKSSKYNTALVGKTADADDNNNNINNSVKNTKIIVSLKYLSNFWRSLEMPLINCKIHVESNWIEDSTKFKITEVKIHVPIVTFSTKDNVNLTKQLSDGFKRPVYWNK